MLAFVYVAERGGFIRPPKRETLAAHWKKRIQARWAQPAHMTDGGLAHSPTTGVHHICLEWVDASSSSRTSVVLKTHPWAPLYQWWQHLVETHAGIDTGNDTHRRQETLLRQQPELHTGTGYLLQRPLCYVSAKPGGSPAKYAERETPSKASRHQRRHIVVIARILVYCRTHVLARIGPMSGSATAGQLAGFPLDVRKTSGVAIPLIPHWRKETSLLAVSPCHEQPSRQLRILRHEPKPAAFRDL